MQITVKDYGVAQDALPAILQELPDGLSAWVSGNDVHVYEDGAEIAIVPILGLSPEEAVDAVFDALEGVI